MTDHPHDVAQERKDRAESLRLTQLALGAEVNTWNLPELAHWVHTGQEMPDKSSDVGDDAATWRMDDLVPPPSPGGIVRE